MKVIYNCRDIVLIQTDKMFAVGSEFQGYDAEGHVIGRNVHYYQNPIEAFNVWICLVEAIGRRKIGEYLKSVGRNPYSGQLDKRYIQPHLEQIKKDC